MKNEKGKIDEKISFDFGFGICKSCSGKRGVGCSLCIW